MKTIIFFNYNVTFKKNGGEYFSCNRLYFLLKKNKFDVFYFNSLAFKSRIKLIFNNNLYYFNGTFHVKLILFLLLNFFFKKKIIISPKGELMPNVLEIKKLKKFFFIYILRKLINEKVQFHCTTKFEKYFIKKLFKKNKLLLAEDLLEIDYEKKKPLYLQLIKNKFTKYQNDKNKTLKIVFYSVISKKKNLEYAFEIISKIKRKIIFHVIGDTNDPRYLSKCEKKTLSFAKNITYKYLGKIENNKSVNTLSRYDIFLFPTTGENFGYVILEAIHGGCFIMTSKNRTPWDHLEKIGISKQLIPYQNNLQSWVKCIEYFNPDYFYTKRNYKKYLAYITKNFNHNIIKKNNLDLFRKL